MLSSYKEQTEDDQVSPLTQMDRYKFNLYLRGYLNEVKLLIFSRLTDAGIFWISYALILFIMGVGSWIFFR